MARKRRRADCIGPARVEGGEGRENRPRAAKKEADSHHASTIQQSWRYRQWKPNRDYRTDPPLFPWFKVSGRWLEHAGFKPNQRLKIEVHDERLVITPA